MEIFKQMRDAIIEDDEDDCVMDPTDPDKR